MERAFSLFSEFSRRLIHIPVRDGIDRAVAGEIGREVFIFKQDLVADQPVVDRGRGGPDAGLLLALGGRDCGLGVGRLKTEVLLKVAGDGGYAGDVSFLISYRGCRRYRR